MKKKRTITGLEVERIFYDARGKSIEVVFQLITGANDLGTETRMPQGFAWSQKTKKAAEELVGAVKADIDKSILIED